MRLISLLVWAMRTVRPCTTAFADSVASDWVAVDGILVVVCYEENYARIAANRFVVSPVSWLNNSGRTVRFGTAVWVRMEYCWREVQRMGRKRTRRCTSWFRFSIREAGFQQNFRAFEETVVSAQTCTLSKDRRYPIGNQLQTELARNMHCLKSLFFCSVSIHEMDSFLDCKNPKVFRVRQ